MPWREGTFERRSTALQCGVDAPLHGPDGRVPTVPDRARQALIPETNMSTMTRRFLSALATVTMAVLLVAWFVVTARAQQPGALRAPTFQVDPAWPTIPNNWVLGEVT